MPNFTPEVRNGKPSQLAKKVILGVSIAFLTSCTPTGKAFVQGTAYETFNYGIQRGIDSEIHRNRMERRNAPRPTGENSIIHNTSDASIEEIAKYGVIVFGSETKQVDGYYTGFNQVGRWIPLPPSYVCTGFEDRNKDGYIGKDELIGLQNSFRLTKDDKKIRIIVGSSWDPIKGKKVTSKITDEKTGEIIKIDEGDGPLISDAAARLTYLDFEKSRDQKGINSYKVEWFVDGRLIPTRTINFFIDYGTDNLTSMKNL